LREVRGRILLHLLLNRLLRLLTCKHGSIRGVDGLEILILKSGQALHTLSKRSLHTLVRRLQFIGEFLRVSTPKRLIILFFRFVVCLS